MGFAVQHNLTAMNSNRMLGTTSSAQAKSTEKLSSGYKINRAADDAAGLSISEKMRKQIRGLTQASTNAADGISTVQTAEGALTEVQDMLQRMNELAVKSANGTNSSTDRNAIQDEIDQLTTEIDRVAETTKFNETYLLKGDANAEKGINYKYQAVDVTSTTLYYVDKNGATKTIEKGTATSGLSTDISYFTSTTTKKAGTQMTAGDTSSFLSTAYAATAANLYTKGNDGNFTLVDKGTIVDTNATYYTMDESGDIATATAVTQITALAESVYVVASGKTLYDTQGVEIAAGQKVGAQSGFAPTNYYTSMANESYPTGGIVSLSANTESSTSQFIDKDGNEIAANGLYKHFNDAGEYQGGLYVKSATGIVEATTAAVTAAVSTAAKYDTGALTLKFHVGADATSNNQISVKIDAMDATTLGIKGLKVDGDDDSNALNAIETVTAALQKVSDQRSALGAVQNRLDHTIKNLDNIVENTTAAESTIRDTNMATEMVRFSNLNILSQAGTSMLAQANQSSQNILSLLG